VGGPEAGGGIVVRCHLRRPPRPDSAAGKSPRRPGRAAGVSGRTGARAPRRGRRQSAAALVSPCGCFSTWGCWRYGGGTPSASRNTNRLRPSALRGPGLKGRTPTVPSGWPEFLGYFVFFLFSNFPHLQFSTSDEARVDAQSGRERAVNLAKNPANNFTACHLTMVP
jgi:hypothetical protein